MSQSARVDTPQFTAKDRETLRAEGIPEERALAQLNLFRQPQAFARLDRACALNDGIVRLSQAERTALSSTFIDVAGHGRALQFTPSSGAATRMFKGMLAILARPEPTTFPALCKEADKGNADAKEVVEWWNNLKSFAFYNSLARSMATKRLDLEALVASKEYRPALQALLNPDGLGYADKPKAVIPFHRYPDRIRTALEEHLVEAADLVRDRQGLCRIHFTVSPDHERLVLSLLDGIRSPLERNGLRLDIGLSTQKPSTNTLAANADNRPFRNPDDTLVFRPGGHGTLLENLFHTGGDFVFIRNIDNILPASAARDEALAWRRALGGYLAGLQGRTFAHIARLMEGADFERVEEAAHFVEQRLGTILPEPMRGQGREAQALEDKRAFLLRTLDRPIRVCAMVKNQGEPGGGPFWVRHKDGSVRMQIVETSQIDLGNSQQKRTLESSTHFNPVDMVCALRDHRGDLFKLQDFVDTEAYLISTKSKDGKPLKALELPGLWNGSMAWWNTAFVETPVETFNPVKTVNDLLRPSHMLPEAK